MKDFFLKIKAVAKEKEVLAKQPLTAKQQELQDLYSSDQSLLFIKPFVEMLGEWKDNRIDKTVIDPEHPTLEDVIKALPCVFYPVLESFVETVRDKANYASKDYDDRKLAEAVYNDFKRLYVPELFLFPVWFSKWSAKNGIFKGNCRNLYDDIVKGLQDYKEERSRKVDALLSEQRDKSEKEQRDKFKDTYGTGKEAFIQYVNALCALPFQPNDVAQVLRHTIEELNECYIRRVKMGDIPNPDKQFLEQIRYGDNNQ